MNNTTFSPIHANVVVDKNNRIFHKRHQINGFTIEHSIYRIPGHNLQRLYNVHINGQLSMAMTFICDNDHYAKDQAYKLVSGLFSPLKLSKSRLKYHKWDYNKGKLTIYD